MNINSSRRGSALLIVLGMMAFIVVSAVAFSAYMRYSRLPSSYLRRTSATRMLAKAALAEAIERIDCAIGNNPSPGVTHRDYTYPRVGGSLIRNTWVDHIFIGMQMSDVASSNDSTVSPLCLEALAYIPGPYVNDARYWARRSSGGEWNTLAFDAGRYVFTAVDVSDCFDVNRMMAGVGRNSSDEGRLTLAHSFENNNHNGYEVDPEEWDKFMSKYTDDTGSKVPLVSVADMNLAIQSQRPGGLESLFGKYIAQTSNAKFVDDENDFRKNMVFVTDSYFTENKTDANGKKIERLDLADEKNQPFYGTKMALNDDEKDAPDFIMAQLNNNFLKKHNELMPLEVAQLYDYLDQDSVPLSLVIPTTERVPMITGIGIENMQLSFEVVPTVKSLSGPVNPATGQPNFVYTVTKGDLVLKGEVHIQAGLVFPFKYKRGSANPTFKAQAAATITLVPKGMNYERSVNGAKSPAVFTRQDWTTSSKNPEAAKLGSEKTPVIISMQSAPKTIQLPSKIEEEEDACLDDVMFDFNQFDVKLVGEFNEVQLQTGVTMPDECKTGTYRQIKLTNNGQTSIIESVCNLEALNADLSNLAALGDGEYEPVINIWVRILDADNNVVDLVPACADDDTQRSSLIDEISPYTSKRRVFCVRSGDKSITGNVAQMLELSGSQDLSGSLSPKGILWDDPRFNHHLSDGFCKTSDTGLNFREDWLNYSRPNWFSDIFMTTSDAGYLQSVYELANILKVSNASGDLDAANRIRWRTMSYTGDNNDLKKYDDIISGTKGYRVNPYTSDLNTLMAVFANTPLDWWTASTNDFETAKQKILDDLDEANKYSFSEMPGAMVKVKHGKLDQNGKAEKGTLMELAEVFRDRMRNSNSDWETVFDNLGWDETDTIAGVDLGVSLHSIDKKFLYGFWRECFANRQQLFLVFVRAEPVMMGGGAKGRTPPQLGARAVALVWRDPAKTLEDVSGQPRPHKTRILFYRQFD